MAKKSSKKIPLPVRIQNAALDLASEQGWKTLSMAEIANVCGVTLAELLQTYPSKSTIIRGFMDRMDEQMLAALVVADLNEPVRDRLFDIIMSRFDGLNLYKKGLIAAARGEACDPITGLCLLIRHRRSLVLMLEAAGLNTSGIRGHLHVKGLALVYANAVRVWVNDDSTDMAKTMAAVDQGLNRAEKIAKVCFSNRNSDANSSVTS